MHEEMALIITVHNHTQVVCNYIQRKGQSERIPLTYHTGLNKHDHTTLQWVSHFSGVHTHIHAK